MALVTSRVFPFNFELKRSRRRTLSVEVRAGKVIVRSPLFLGDRRILEFVSERTAWIMEKVEETKAGHVAEAENEILFLGEKFRILQWSGGESIIDELGKTISLSGYGENKKDLVKKFYIQETKKIVEKYLAEFRGDFSVCIEGIRYKFYKSKWGSCSAKNKLSFNAYLCSAPRDIIRYVVIHELCHIRVKNHSRKFWEQVAYYLPEYKIKRRYLRQHNIAII